MSILTVKLLNPTDVNLEDKAGKLIMDTMVLTNDSFINGDQKVGDPTELALVELGRKYNIIEQDLREKYPRISELPFDSVRKFMSTLQIIDNEKLMLTKGATDELLKKM